MINMNTYLAKEISLNQLESKKASCNFSLLKKQNEIPQSHKKKGRDDTNNGIGSQGKQNNGVEKLSFIHQKYQDSKWLTTTIKQVQTPLDISRTIRLLQQGSIKVSSRLLLQEASKCLLIKNCMLRPLPRSMYLSFNWLESYYSRNTTMTFEQNLKQLFSQMEDTKVSLIRQFIVIDSRERDVILELYLDSSVKNEQFLVYMINSGMFNSITQPLGLRKQELNISTAIPLEIRQNQFKSFCNETTSICQKKETFSKECQNDIVDYQAKKFDEKQLTVDTTMQKTFLPLSQQHPLSKIPKIQSFTSIFSLGSLWQNGLQRNLNQKARHFQAYEYSVKQPLSNFVSLMEYYDLKTKLYMVDQGPTPKPLTTKDLASTSSPSVVQQLYPQIIDLCREFNDKMKVKNIDQSFEEHLTSRSALEYQSLLEERQVFLSNFKKQRLKGYPKPSILNEILIFFIKQRRNVNKNGTRLMLSLSNNASQNTRTTLSQYMGALYHFFEVTKGWANIFETITYDFMVKMPSQMRGKYHHQEQAKKDKQMGEIQRAIKPNYHCLGCCRFLVQNQNIYDYSLSLAPVRAFKSIHQLQSNTNQILQWTVAMLNSGGGIMLFDCVNEYGHILPKGTTMSERQKVSFKRQFDNLIIYKVEPKRAFTFRVDFLPVIKNSAKKYDQFIINYAQKQQKIKRDQKITSVELVKGKQAARITTYSDSPQTVFSIHPTKTQRGMVTNIVMGSKREIVGRKLSRLIKSKVKRAIRNSRYESKEQTEMLGRPWRYFDHTCQPPLEVSSSKNQHSSRESTFSPEFKYATMVKLPPQQRSVLVDLLAKNGVKARLMNSFGQYRLKNHNKYGLLYHSVSFAELMKIITPNTYSHFNGKPLLIIKVTSYLHLNQQETPFTHQDLDRLAEWLGSQFPGQRLSYYEYVTSQQQKEYYIATGSKASLYFMYLVLSHFRQAARFHDPALLSMVPKEEKMHFFRLKYESQVSNEIVGEREQQASEVSYEKDVSGPEMEQKSSRQTKLLHSQEKMLGLSMFSSSQSLMQLKSPQIDF